MAISATTLSGAIGATDSTLQVASATGITAPYFPTGVGTTYLMIDNELDYVISTNGVIIGVIRGIGGTRAVSHADGTPILIGAPSDFANFTPATSVTTNRLPLRFAPVGATVASAATITPSGSLFVVSGTTTLVQMNVPTGMVNGQVTIIFSSSQAGNAWQSGGTAGKAFAVTGTNTTAGSAVTFTYLASTGLWYPSRLA